MPLNGNVIDVHGAAQAHVHINTCTHIILCVSLRLGCSAAGSSRHSNVNVKLCCALTVQWVKLEKKDRRMWQTGPESCIMCICVQMDFTWRAHLVYSCVCALMCVTAWVRWPVVQLRSTNWLPLLDRSLFLVTSKHLIISSSITGIQHVLFFLTINLLSMRSLCPSYSFYLSVCSLCHQLLRQQWVAVSSFWFEMMSRPAAQKNCHRQTFKNPGEEDLLCGIHGSEHLY